MQHQDQLEGVKPDVQLVPAIEPQNQTLNVWQLWNMSFGFLGIQFGWGLQMANMSAIFEFLGADASQIPMLWLAAPLTGLIVQPIIGNLSDYTWGPLGRRRPYFLFGAIFASIALICMPQASTLWMAAGLLWILDTCANISMEPFRAFVGDLLPREQRTRGFAMQSLMIGIGSVSASALPWVLKHLFHVQSFNDPTRRIPLAVELSFYIGAALLFSTVLWTVLTTQEHPPHNFETFRELKERRGGFRNSLRETWQAVTQMPLTMKKLAIVQCFTWLGLFCFFLYFPPAVAWTIFRPPSQESALYAEGIEWAGVCFAVYNAVCVGFSFALPYLAKRFGRQMVHGVCLLCGGVGLVSLGVIRSHWGLLLPMVGVGLAWASVLAMPYAMLVGAIPAQRRGIYMGIFNFFIVLPEVLVSLGFGWVMRNVLHDDRMMAVVLGGLFLIVAAALTPLVQVVPATGLSSEEAIAHAATDAEIQHNAS